MVKTRTILMATMLLAAMGLSFLAGTTFGDRPGATQAQDHPVPAEIAGPMNDFWRAYDLLNQNSYWSPLDKKKLIYEAINGMLSGGTGDAHTIFLGPTDSAQANSQFDGSFDGIGAYVDMTPQGLVLDPLKGSPAMKAGLRAKDLVTRVDGVELAGMSQDDAVQRIRGKVGTIVHLTIVRAGVAEPFTVSVTRGHIVVPTVTSRMYGDIAYLEISQFNSDAGTQVPAQLKTLLAQKPRGLVLDLRDNPGGYLDVAVKIASQFIASGPIVWEQKNNKTETALSAAPGGLATAIPMAVLVNASSASASEILTGALQDDHRATVIGTTTYGKGSVQLLFPFDDGSQARITTALWLTPQQHLIQGKGITPNIVVLSPVDATQDGTPADQPLQRALAVLRQ
jgi:carboxyl-terminal processing protease